jgi:hypothetical protein
MFGGLIVDMMVDGGVVLPPSSDTSGIATFVLKLTINIVDELENPYA